MPCAYIWYREAARLMGQPADYYRIKNPDGSYKHFPKIERWQPRGKGTRLYVKRADVERWIEESRTPVQAPVKKQFTGIGYESAAATAHRLGATGTLKSFGLK